MTKFDSTRFSAAGPIFKVTCNRAKKSLDAEVLIVLLSNMNRAEFDLHIEDESAHADSSRIYYDLKGMDPDNWEKLKSISEIMVFDQEESDPFISNLMETTEATTIIICPLSAENVDFGHVVWGWKSARQIARDFIVRATLLADQIALSLSASMSEKRSQEQGEKLAALLELSTSIYSSLNYKEVIHKAVKLSMEIVDANGGTMFLLDKEENVLVPLVTIDETHAEAINSMRLKPGEGLTGWVAETGVGLISNHSEIDPRSVQVPGTPIEPESLISAPLTWSGDVIGVITMRNCKGKQFVQEDLEILTIFARQAADAIENAKLYEKLERAYEELSATQERLILAEKLKALGEMAGGVAHDFNNILATVLGRVQLLLKKIDDPELTNDLEVVEESALEGRRTVRRLQDFTQVSSKSRHTNISLNDVVTEAIENTKPFWKSTALKKGVTINLHQDLRLIPDIEGSFNELKEAVSNVILNSVDALCDGGNILIETGEVDEKIYLRITDDGVGMDEETKNKMFFPFFSTKEEKGSGMGLAVVYGILFRHQVEIMVESSPGNGAEFILKFAPARESGHKTVQPRISEDLSQLDILLVDDDLSLLDVVDDMLDYLGHKCHKANGGGVAIDILKKKSFDLVVTDLGMPEVGGWEVAQYCRDNHPETPVILISGWGAQIDSEEAGDKVDAVLPKPFQLDEFEETIKTVIHNGRQKQPVSR
ncbi:MAG: GAF domain-containing protein [candidate division Zixibacteria bacterium]